MSKTPYKTIAEAVESWCEKNGYETMLVSIALRYDCEKEWRETTEILDIDGYSLDFVWQNDWWEGEQNVKLLGFAPLSDLHLRGNSSADVVPLDYHERCLQIEVEKRLALELQTPRLIPVSEKLPDTDGDYLVWFYDARCWKVAEYSKHTAKERHVWWFAGIDRTKFVTHWMPLPEPPEEDV